MFCNDDGIAQALLDAGGSTSDPMWRMPLQDGYRRVPDSRVADLNNIASVSQGGAITAALYLREFVGARIRWAHIDTMAWNSQGRSGRPMGGDVQGVRACFSMLAARYGS